jgi:hypothetical protein
MPDTTTRSVTAKIRFPREILATLGGRVFCVLSPATHGAGIPRDTIRAIGTP